MFNKLTITPQHMQGYGGCCHQPKKIDRVNANQYIPETKIDARTSYNGAKCLSHCWTQPSKNCRLCVYAPSISLWPKNYHATHRKFPLGRASCLALHGSPGGSPQSRQPAGAWILRCSHFSKYSAAFKALSGRGPAHRYHPLGQWIQSCKLSRPGHAPQW